MSSLNEKIYNLTELTGATFSEVALVAAEFSQAGMQEDTIVSLLTDATTLARLTGLELKRCIAAIQIAQSSFTEYPMTSSQIVNKLICVDANFETSVKDLCEVLLFAGEAASREAQVGFDELLGFAAAASTLTKESGEFIGKALQTLFVNTHKFKSKTFYEGFETLSRAWHLFSEQEAQETIEQLVSIEQGVVVIAILIDFSKDESIFFQVLDALIDGKKNKKPLIQISIGPDEHGLYSADTRRTMKRLAESFPAYDFVIKDGDTTITVFND